MEEELPSHLCVGLEVLLSVKKHRKEKTLLLLFRLVSHNTLIWTPGNQIPSNMTMESLPPNDPNRNNNNNPSRQQGKEDPFDGRQRGGNNNNGGTVDFFGNMEDQPVVVMMFLVGVATWFLKERCVC